MKKIVITFLLVSICGTAMAGKVRGYMKKNGTYVMPHQRTAPDGRKSNNYSTKGNFNPYTGEAGKQ